MTLDLKLLAKEEKRARVFDEIQREMFVHPVRYFVKGMFLPGYAARFGLNAPKDEELLRLGFIGAEISRDLWGVFLAYQFIEYLTR